MRVALLLFLLLLSSIPVSAQRIQVLAWSERSEPAEIYPRGINGAVEELLKLDRRARVTVANLLDPEQGLSEAALARTDVLVWFGHRSHEAVSDESVKRVVRHVKERGMGFLPLHSAHYCRPFQELMRIKAKQAGVKLDGIVGKWGQVRNEGKPESIRVLDPRHAITKGVADFVIPASEMYGNPFNVPPPDAKILEGSWVGGEQHGSDGMIWYVGRGKVFYLRPGHETRPVFRQAEIQQVIRNAVRWLAKPHGGGTSD